MHRTCSSTLGTSSAEMILRVSTPAVIRRKSMPGAFVRVGSNETYALTASSLPAPQESYFLVYYTCILACFDKHHQRPCQD